MSRMYRGGVPSNLGGGIPTSGPRFVEYRPDPSPFETLQGIFGAARSVAGAANQLSDISRQQARRQLLEDEQAKKSFAAFIDDQIDQVLIDNPDSPSGREEGLVRLAGRYLDNPYQDIAFSRIGKTRAENSNAYGREMEREAASAQKALESRFMSDLIRNPPGEDVNTLEDIESYYLEENKTFLEGLDDESRESLTLQIVRHSATLSNRRLGAVEDRRNQDQKESRPGEIIKTLEGALADDRKAIPDVLDAGYARASMLSGGQTPSVWQNDLLAQIPIALRSQLDGLEPEEKIERLEDLKSRMEDPGEDRAYLLPAYQRLRDFVEGEQKRIVRDVQKDHETVLDSSVANESEAVRSYMADREGFLNRLSEPYKGESKNELRAFFREDMEKRVDAFNQGRDGIFEIQETAQTNPAALSSSDADKLWNVYLGDGAAAILERGTPEDVLQMMGSGPAQFLTRGIMPVPPTARRTVEALEQSNNPDDVAKAAILNAAFNGRVGSDQLTFAAGALNGRPATSPITELVNDRYSEYPNLKVVKLATEDLNFPAPSQIDFAGYDSEAASHKYDQLTSNPEFLYAYRQAITQGKEPSEATDFAVALLQENGFGLVYQTQLSAAGKAVQVAQVIPDSQRVARMFPQFEEALRSEKNLDMVVRKAVQDSKGQLKYSSRLAEDGNFYVDPISFVESGGKSAFVRIYTENNAAMIVTIDVSNVVFPAPDNGYRLSGDGNPSKTIPESILQFLPTPADDRKPLP